MPTPSTPTLPLAGVRVLDFTRILAGPFCTMQLADMGADVIKVESFDGDDTRTWGPPFDAKGRSAYYLSINRNKRGIALDLKHPDGRQIAQQLAAQAHIVVENFRVGGMASFGLGFEDVRALNPAVVYASITGFGQTVPVLIVAVSIIQMMGVVRTTRAAGIVLMEQGYVRAAQLNGEGGAAVVVRELLPNVLDLMAVEFALRASSALLLVSALSFLGLGISPPTPDWGLMVEDGMALLNSEPWLVLAPALAISSLVLAINLAAEGLAEAFGLDAARGGGG